MTCANLLVLRKIDQKAVLTSRLDHLGTTQSFTSFLKFILVKINYILFYLTLSYIKV